MVLGKLPVPRRPTIWITVGQGPTALAVGAGGSCLDIFSSFVLSLLFLLLFGRRLDRVVVVVVLHPRLTSKVMSGRSVNLTTLFLGRLRPPKRLTSTSCTYFRR